MADIYSKLQTLGIDVPIIYLPKKGVDMTKWAVVACDQYTSEPEYWEKVEALVGGDPSTYRITFPEIFLEEPDKEDRISKINATMNQYLDTKVLEPKDPGFVLVKRDTKSSPTRWGLMVALDLEQYSYAKDSKTPIRATEGTIVERIPPRVEIRKNAPLEFPHIMVLLDDPNKLCIEPLIDVVTKDRTQPVYDFDLMAEGGHITGYHIASEELLNGFADGLAELHSPKRCKERYGIADQLIYAMGDGNHSLATAKSCWETLKAGGAPMDHPARWALVELVNIFDAGIVFEPIHRVIFDGDYANFCTYLQAGGSDLTETAHPSMESVIVAVEAGGKDGSHVIGITRPEGLFTLTLKNPKATIAAGSVQTAMDSYLSGSATSGEGTANKNTVATVDYIHGSDVTMRLGSEAGNFGILLPALRKEEFFGSIVHDGALPRKTFSMGEAEEKRFYLEGRIIR